VYLAAERQGEPSVSSVARGKKAANVGGRKKKSPSPRVVAITVNKTSKANEKKVASKRSTVVDLVESSDDASDSEVPQAAKRGGTTRKAVAASRTAAHAADSLGSSPSTLLLHELIAQIKTSNDLSMQSIRESAATRIDLRKNIANTTTSPPPAVSATPTSQRHRSSSRKERKDRSSSSEEYSSSSSSSSDEGSRRHKKRKSHKARDRHHHHRAQLEALPADPNYLNFMHSLSVAYLAAPKYAPVVDKYYSKGKSSRK
jgi:hypothetical protein